MYQEGFFNPRPAGRGTPATPQPRAPAGEKPKKQAPPRRGREDARRPPTRGAPKHQKGHPKQPGQRGGPPEGGPGAGRGGPKAQRKSQHAAATTAAAGAAGARPASTQRNGGQGARARPPPTSARPRRRPRRPSGRRLEWPPLPLRAPKAAASTPARRRDAQVTARMGFRLGVSIRGDRTRRAPRYARKSRFAFLC